MEIPGNFHWICPQSDVLFGLVLYIDPLSQSCPLSWTGSFADAGSLFFRTRSRCDYEIHKLEQAGGRFGHVPKRTLKQELFSYLDVPLGSLGSMVIGSMGYKL